MTDRQWKALKITAMVVVSLPIVWVAVVFVMMSVAASQNWSELESETTQIPKSVLAVAIENPDDRIEYYRLRNGFDLSMTVRGFVRIDGVDNVRRFIELGALESTDGKHPKRAEFDSSLRLIDPSVIVEGDVWYASLGFGTVHQEYVDLYLLRTTKDRASAIVYHYWTF